MDRKIEVDDDRQIEDRQIDRQRERMRGRQVERKRERQTDRQIER